MTADEQMTFFYEIFDASLPRLGPGDGPSTRRALDGLLASNPGLARKAESAELRILDLGCGNGAQTIELAGHLDGTILAVDNYQPFLDELQRRAEAAGVADKIRPCCQDMGNLGLSENSFDLIWSEGALYNMGFKAGLKRCRKLLAPGGRIAVSELVWLQPDPPEACRRFFGDEYPAMLDVGANVTAIQDCGYDLLGHFILPESAWRQSYYEPLEQRLNMLRKTYAGDRQRLGMIDGVETEIDMYRKYASFYGYVFFLMRPGRIGL